METPTYIMLSKEEALSRQMDVAAQNMAAANNSGYKAREVIFEEYLQPQRGTFNKNPAHFVVDYGTYRNIGQGVLVQTGNPLDIAISGQGYFAVATDQGTQYTRQGSFQLNPDGTLVTADGFAVLNTGGQRVTIPKNAKHIGIGSDGTVATDAGDQGRLQIASFSTPQAMAETYGGYYTTSEAPLPQNPHTTLVQGSVEASNVQAVTQMASIIEISRAYTRIANLISNENDRLKNAISRLGKVS